MTSNNVLFDKVFNTPLNNSFNSEQVSQWSDSVKSVPYLKNKTINYVHNRLDNLNVSSFEPNLERVTPINVKLQIKSDQITKQYKRKKKLQKMNSNDKKNTLDPNINSVQPLNVNNYSEFSDNNYSYNYNKNVN